MAHVLECKSAAAVAAQQQHQQQQVAGISNQVLYSCHLLWKFEWRLPPVGILTMGWAGEIMSTTTSSVNYHVAWSTAVASLSYLHLWTLLLLCLQSLIVLLLSQHCHARLIGNFVRESADHGNEKYSNIPIFCYAELS
jgi:hypothetical protein